VGAIAADGIVTSVVIEIIAIALSLIEEIKAVVRGRREIVPRTLIEIAVVPGAGEPTGLEAVVGDGHLLVASLVGTAPQEVEAALVVAAMVRRMAEAIVHQGVAGRHHHYAGGEWGLLLLL
jgi:hypothetical protein